MGATTWDYFTPYDEDAGAAFRRLRKKVFREGRYERFVPSPEDMEVIRGKPRTIDPNTPLEDQARIRQQDTLIHLATRIRKMLGEWGDDSVEPEPDYARKPRTIKGLLKEQGESGTHSILDIQHLSIKRKSGAISPMPVERLRELFGTNKPTRKMIENKLGDPDLIKDPLVAERWQGVYFTVYRDDRPDELFFIGTSGD